MSFVATRQSAAALAAMMLALALLIGPAAADYVSGLNPRGDNYLSLRTGPGSGYREILRMGPDTVLEILERQGEWRRVRLEDGSVGWAFGRYIRPGYPPGHGGYAPIPPAPGAPSWQEQAPAPGQTTGQMPTDRNAADMERLKLEAEIERLKLEQLKLQQTQRPTRPEVSQAPGRTPDPAGLPVVEGRRVALVIGNGAYGALSPLSTPVNDARETARALMALGYETEMGLDLTRAQMADKLAQFHEQAQGAGVAVFYFSGHGMQIGGRNYLLPVDAAFPAPSAFLDVDARAIDLQKYVSASAQARIGVTFVDACRDNPVVEKSLGSGMSKSGAGETKGLAVIARETLNSGQFVGFAAEPGKTAETGSGPVSVYTRALLDSLAEPGLDISIMHRRIRTAVEEATRGRQSPRYVDDLADAFALNPKR